MKKVLITVTLLFLLVFLVACGETATTTAATTAATNAEKTAQTTPQTTTESDTSAVIPDNSNPVLNLYNVIAGYRFDVRYSLDGYCMTAYNLQGNPIMRRVYEFGSMTSPDDAYTFSYRYDENGKLVEFAFTGGGYTEPTAEFIERSGDRLSSALIYINGVHLNAFWLYDENNIITTESYHFGDNWWFSYAYDTQGRLTKETLFNFDDKGSVEYCLTTYTENGAHYALEAEDEILLNADVTFNEVGCPVTLKGIWWGLEREFTYTYNNKYLCTQATAKGGFGTQEVENTYDEKGYLVKSTVSNDDGRMVYEYSYHNTGRVAVKTELIYDADNTYKGKYVYSYEYDAKGNVIRAEEKAYNETPEVVRWSLYEYTYGLGTFGSNLEMMVTHFDSNGAVISKLGTTKTYNGKNFISKEINTSYSATGEVTEKRVQEYLYHNMEILYQVNESFYEGETLIHKIERSDNNGVKKTVEYHYSKEDGSLTKKTELVLMLDHDGVLVKSEYKEYDGEEKMRFREVSEYQDGMLVKTTYYDADGNVTKVEGATVPTSVSYAVRYEGFLYTVFDENGRVAERLVYDRDTMKRRDSSYVYRYDENGKLNGFTFVYRGDATEFTLAYSEDGKTVTATAVDDPAYTYVIGLDDSGKIRYEAEYRSETSFFKFEYDEKGYITGEDIHISGMELRFESTYENASVKMVSKHHGTPTDVTIVYNEAGYPISLEGAIGEQELFNSYTYDKKNLCTATRFFGNYEEYICTNAYDEKGRLIKSVLENKDTGRVEEECYSYDADGRMVRYSCNITTDDGEGDSLSATTYEYDADGRCTKRVEYVGGDEESYLNKIIYSFVYNDAGKLAEQTEGYEFRQGHFELRNRYTYEYNTLGLKTKLTWTVYQSGKVHTVYEIEYDEKGDIVKETVSYYDENGNLVEQEENAR